MSARSTDTIIFSSDLSLLAPTVEPEPVAPLDLGFEESLTRDGENELDIVRMERIVAAMRLVLHNADLTEEARETTMSRLRQVAGCGVIGGRVLHMFALAPPMSDG